MNDISEHNAPKTPPGANESDYSEWDDDEHEDGLDCDVDPGYDGILGEG